MDLTASRLLESLRKDGFEVRRDGKNLKIRPAPEGKVLDQVRIHKAGILAELDLEEEVIRWIEHSKRQRDNPRRDNPPALPSWLGGSRS